MNKTIAEEAVCEKALQLDGRPFDCDEIELPKETPNQLIDHFMNNTETCPAHQTAINNLLLPVIDTSFVDTNNHPFHAFTRQLT